MPTSVNPSPNNGEGLGWWARGDLNSRRMADTRCPRVTDNTVEQDLRMFTRSADDID